MLVMIKAVGAVVWNSLPGNQFRSTFVSSQTFARRHLTCQYILEIHRAYMLLPPTGHRN